MLDTLVPRLRPSMHVYPRGDGTAVALDSETGSHLEIAADQAQLALLVDGLRSIADVVGTHFDRHGAVSFVALGDLLERLRRAGFLDNSDAELDEAGVARRPKPPLLQRLASMLLVRVRSGAAAPVAGALGALGLVACLAALVAPAGGAPASVDPLLPGGSALAGIVGVLLGALAGACLRSAARATAAAVLGAGPQAFELRLHFVLPVPGVEAGTVQRLERGRRAVCHLVALAASWLAAAAAASLAVAGDGPAFASVALGAALVGFLDAVPFAPTSLGQALASLAGRVDLRDHARAYLVRRFVSRIGSRGMFDGEKTIVLTSVLSLLWSVAAIRIVASHASLQLVRLVHRAMVGQGAEAGAAWLLAGLVLAASLAALAGLGVLLFAAVRSAAPGFFRRRPSEGARAEVSGADAAAALRRVPLFTSLAPEALDEVAKAADASTFRTGEIVVRQGDPGSRFFAVVSGSVDIVREHESGLQSVVATLGAGDCFGETALLEATARTATVRAATQARLLTVGRAGFERLVRELPGVDLTRALRASAALRRSSIAAALPPERVAEIVPHLVSRHAAEGEVICRVGDPGDYFYLIDAGQVEVLGESGARAALLGAGESFGETALLLGTPRTATVRAVQSSELWALSRVNLYSALSRNAALSDTLAHRAETRVAAAE